MCRHYLCLVMLALVAAGFAPVFPALGNEAIGNYVSAANHYRQFVRLVPDSRYAARARANLSAIEKRTGKRIVIPLGEIGL